MHIKTLLLLFLIIVSAPSFSQSLESHRDSIKQAQRELQPAFEEFSKNLLEADLSLATQKLQQFNGGKLNPYQQYLIGGVLYEIDPSTSFLLHEQAYLAKPDNTNFILEYALELHRKRSFEKAANLYEQYLIKNADDYRIKALLADCLINQNKVKQAVESWIAANHRAHHTGIDKAIHIVYGRTDQMKRRSDLIDQIRKENDAGLEELIFMDINWEMDWWNTQIQEYLLDHDMKLAKDRLGIVSQRYKMLETYKKIKTAKNMTKDELIQLLTEANLMLHNTPIPAYGKFASEILRVCLAEEVIKAKDFYQLRGKELLTLSQRNKDVEYLNMFAHLQLKVEGKVSPEIDKQGWKEFKDERFAVSYLIGQKSERCKGPELNEIQADYPTSSAVYWFEVDCIKTAGKKLTPYLIELIKKDFQSLKSDQNRYSYQLNSYFMLLKQEL